MWWQFKINAIRLSELKIVFDRDLLEIKFGDKCNLVTAGFRNRFGNLLDGTVSFIFTEIDSEVQFNLVLFDCFFDESYCHFPSSLACE